MSATLLLCESASENADGTFSIIRGGFSHWELPSVPGTMNLTVFVRLPPGTPKGRHGGSIEIARPDGTTEKLTVDFVVPTSESPFFVLPIAVPAPAYGTFTFTVKVLTHTAAQVLAVRPLSKKSVN